MNEGMKFDDGKIRPSIVLGDFSLALQEICKVGGYGIDKYGASNWLMVNNAHERYDNALLRHWLEGKAHEFDTESGHLHVAHTAWNALACLELKLRESKALSGQPISDDFDDGDGINHGVMPQ